MHIPDGFIDAKTAAATGIAAIGAVALALKKLRNEPKNVPLIGLGAAFVFAAQMLNFPVAVGTSGHLLGATLMAAVFGLPAAILIMTTVLIVQALVFADGGITALGANILNMAVIAPTVGYFILHILRKALGNKTGLLAGVCFGGWCSTVCAALACALELKLSGTVPSNLIFPAMAGIHALIGIGEGIISALVVVTLNRIDPQLLAQAGKSHATPTGHLLGFGFAVIIGIVAIGAPLACSWPDGLELVAENLGFSGKAFAQPIFPAPAPDYSIPIENLRLGFVGTIVAGLLGTLLVYAMSLLVAKRLLAKNSADRQVSTPEASNNTR